MVYSMMFGGMSEENWLKLQESLKDKILLGFACGDSHRDICYHAE